MKDPPAYFEPIRLESVRRWEQLEQDRGLAGPWYQLFRQVQSPRHVVSELLQNADDAGATEASIRVENGRFVFEHNGVDFTGEQFTSLCGFGYSNKRALHTIGFRGIGFKSTFSLGDSVELFTPTLAISFHRTRFTEPRWLSEDVDTDGWTRVRVAMSDPHRQDEVVKNLEEWLTSPLSLLFFRTIRLVRIGDRTVRWKSLRPGPIPNSEWMALDDKKDDEILILRSDEEAFPEEALAEIREERVLAIEEDGEFPPCRVEIAMGAKGRLFVVLPTGVETELPFACNAPFIQDPARLKIKDPETSPTNRWLLQRAGELAGTAMLRWLGQPALPTDERARAYELLPDVNWDDNSPGGVSGTIVEKAFKNVIASQPVLLTDSGDVVQAQAGVILPGTVFAIWPTEPIAEYFDERGRPALCRSISAPDGKKLRRWALVDEIDKPMVLARLQAAQPPKPTTRLCLLHLWAYIAPEITGYARRAQPTGLRIVPVQGSNFLFAANEVVRLGERKLLQSDEDWDFLAPYLRIMDPDWPAYLANGHETVADPSQAPAQRSRDAATAVLKETGLDGATPVDVVVARVAGKLFGTGVRPLSDCLRLAQIVAKLGGRVPTTFQFCTEDGKPRSIQTGVVWDGEGLLSPLLPSTWSREHLLHSDYTSSFVSCSRDDWRAWASSARSGLHLLPPIEGRESGREWSRRGFEASLRQLGYRGEYWYPYMTSRPYPYQSYWIIDFDFDPALRKYMRELPDDHGLWRVIARLLLEVPATFWRGKEKVEGKQTSTNGQSTGNVSLGVLPSAWVREFSERAVLRDIRGVYRKPNELFRRTPETESLLDVEPFVDAWIDTEAARPLLDLLGVRSVPSGPEAFLERLRALAGSENPPVHEVDKWYGRIDRFVETCSTADLAKIRQAFSSERLILTQDGAWAAASVVFLSSDEEDVPGAATVRLAVSDLTLWRKIDVAERPTADLALAWLRALPSDRALAPDDARRVRALLGRHPTRIWDECGHWLNLAGAWVPVAGLEYALTMQSLFPWGHLFPWVKDKTAHLQSLPTELTRNPPFSRLQALAQKVEERLDLTLQFVGPPENRQWLAAIGAGLCRAQFESDEETRRIRARAAPLARTSWRAAAGLTITPYIDGTPAGAPRKVDVLWHDLTLYVEHLTNAKLARRIPEEIGRAFGRPDIQAALAYGFERPLADVSAYLEENFSLAEAIDDDGERSAGEIEASPLGPDVDADVRTESAGAAGDDDGEHSTRDDGPDIAQPDPEYRVDTEAPVDPGVIGGLHRRPASPTKLSMIERFAGAQGFRMSGDGRYRHPDGSWITRSDASHSWWDRWTVGGELVRCYRAIDHCLEQAPLVLDADVWGLIEQSPERYALILSNTEGDAVEVTGTRLRTMREQGELTLYPAAYRLVVENDGR